MQTQKQKKIGFALGIVSALLIFVFLPYNASATEYTLDNLNNLEEWQINQDINNKRSEIQELNRQIGVYKKNINAKQRESGNLNNQVSTINDSIAKVNLEVKAVELEIETINLQIENKELRIQAKEKEIGGQKEIVSQILRSIHSQQQRNSLLEILLLNDNFSDFMSELDRLESMQDSLVSEIDGLNTIKIALGNDRQDLETEEDELDTLGSILDAKVGDLDGQKAAKQYLLSITRGQESKFQTLLSQAREEQEQINSDIVYLEKVAREKLNRQLALEELESDGFMWPIPSRVITTYFRDPTYPFRYIFEHNAIDVATPQGTAVRAVDSGYVAKARDGGQTGYSYIIVVHTNGLSTVYGHVNQISIASDQFVSKGQIIGYSGGYPGTRGAGPFSTGPHLHLEIRSNGIPVNPLNYLP